MLVLYCRKGSDMNVEDFMENEKPRKKRSVFDCYRDDILMLLDSDYTQLQVIEFLKKKSKSRSGLSQQNLSLWLKRNKITLQSDPRNSQKNIPVKIKDSDKNQNNNANATGGREETKKRLHEAAMIMYPKPDYLEKKQI